MATHEAWINSLRQDMILWADAAGIPLIWTDTYDDWMAEPRSDPDYCFTGVCGWVENEPYCIWRTPKGNHYMTRLEEPRPC